MSQAWITPIFADIKKVQNIPGSKDQKLFKKTLSDFAEDIAGENEWVSEWNNDEPETIQKCLTEIISGDLKGGQYGYASAFQYLCKEVGEIADIYIEFYPFEYEEFLGVLKEEKQLPLLHNKWRDLIENKGLGINLPKNDKAIWPVSTYITQIEAEKMLEEMEEVGLFCDNEDHTIILEGLKETLGKTAKKKSDVLLFLSES